MGSETQKLNDLRAEQKVLSCLLKSEAAWQSLPENFTADAMSSSLNRSLFIVIDSLYSKGAKPDPITVAEGLPENMQTELREIGEWGFLDTLRDLPIDPKNVEIVAKELIDLQTRRNIETTGKQISEMSVSPKPVSNILEDIELTINDLEGTTNLEVKLIGKDGIDYVSDKVSHPAEVPGLSGGFGELDKSIQGFQPGCLYVVGARKKTGKSMVLLNFAKHIAVDQNIPILWISNEHAWQDEYTRLLALTSQVSAVTINNGTFSEVPVHSERVEHAIERLAEAPFYFCSFPTINLAQIKRLARKFARVHGIKALFFDLLKMPEGEASNKEWQELGILAYGLKSLALAEKIAVISAVQVNREGAASFKADGEYDSDYFAGSDRIAQALDVAMILRPPSKAEAADPQYFRVLRVSDARNVASNYKALLEWNPEIMQLREVKRV